MNFRFKPLAGILFTLSSTLLPMTGFAANNEEVKLSEQVKRLEAQTQLLEQQLSSVQHELGTIENHKNRASNTKLKSVAPSRPSTRVVTRSAARPVRAATNVEAPPVADINPPPAPSMGLVDPEQIKPGEHQRVTAYSENVVPATVEKDTKLVPFGQHSLANLGGFAVITSPYLHPEQEYSGGDLVVNYSSINKDIAMLQQRQNFQHAMRSFGFGMPKTGSLLELSGKVEGQIYNDKRFDGRNTSNITISDAQLDMQALINRWFTAFMSFDYDSSPINSGNITANSRLFVDNAFITVGNLDVSPLRLTLGQIYVPFGVYNSFLVSNPINKVLFRTKGRPLLLGYGVPGEPGLSGAVFVFKGDTRLGKTELGNEDREINGHINQYGLDGSFAFQLGMFSFNLGASFINNVADADGMQFNAGDDIFEGFAQNRGTEVLSHRVPGGDLRAKVAVDHLTFLAEYTEALRSFSAVNLSYNGYGARPSAYHVEGVYSFDFFTKPGTFAIGYDQSHEALALLVPRKQLAAALNISFWRNTLASLEVRHQWNYSDSTFANGNLNGNLAPPFFPVGSSENAVTFQFDVYF